MLVVSGLFIYPVKSLGGIGLQSTLLTDRGLQYDRRWMLIDDANRFISQREVPLMALLGTAIEGDKLIIFKKAAPKDALILDLNPVNSTLISVQMFKDDCKAVLVGEGADEWFSKKLGVSCRLVYMPDKVRRPVDNMYALHNDITSLSDGYPILMIGEASLNDLNDRLQEPLPMNRFRPNIVFTGREPYVEDTLQEFKINGISFYAVKPCSRCVVTTINQETTATGKEPLATLSKYRKEGHRILFGQNILYQGTGTIYVGDEIKIIKTKPHLQLAVIPGF